MHAGHGRQRSGGARVRGIRPRQPARLPGDATKRAYLISSVFETGASYVVRRTSGARSCGHVGTSLGRWSARFRHVYALDLTGHRRRAVRRRRLRAGRGGLAAVRGRPGAADLYGGALHNALSFYEDERDGPDYIRSELRTAPGHLNDEHAQTYLTPKVDGNGAFKATSLARHSIDAAGGWWDAGDYLKFVQTTSYTVALMLTGVRDFPARWGPAAASNFTAEARFGVQWLLRMWNDRTRTLYYQVGIGEGNSRHDRRPRHLAPAAGRRHYGGRNPAYRYIRHRPVFRAGPPGSPVSPNLAGRDAAAFGLCFQVFRGTTGAWPHAACARARTSSRSPTRIPRRVC